VLGKFDTGATVTMVLYDPATESIISLTAGTCNEIASTGVFRWYSSDIIIQPVSRTVYLWIMSDGTMSQYGKIEIGGYPDDILNAVGSIGSGTGAALNYAAQACNVSGAIKGIGFVGVQSSGTYLSTYADDGIKHQITHSGNAIDIVYSFNIGAGRNASKAVLKGYLLSSNDTITVQAYNGSTWDTRAIINGQNTSTNITKDIALLQNHTGTGTEAGWVYLRFVCSGMTSPVLYIDELLVAGANIGLTVGYLEGAVWIDSIKGEAGTTAFVHGTADNPVASLTDALAICTAIGLSKLKVAPGTLITLSTNSDSWIFSGGGKVDLNGQSIADSNFEGLYTISGIGIGDDIFIENCGIGNVTLEHCYLSNCRMKGTFTTVAGDVYFIMNCRDCNESDDVQTFVYSAGAKIMLRNWAGGVKITNMSAGDELILDGAGRLIIDGSCTGGSITIRGNFPLPTGYSDFIEAGGSISQTARFATDQIMADEQGVTDLRKYHRCEQIIDPDEDTLTLKDEDGNVLMVFDCYLDKDGLVSGTDGIKRMVPR
jgi:hypothetical protein